MLRKFQGLLFSGAILVSWGTAQATLHNNPYFRHFTNQGIAFDLVDRLKLPQFSWPTTLVTYPVEFSACPTAEQDLELVDVGTRKDVDFQLSDVVHEGDQLAFARISFFTDLSSGGSHHYLLRINRNRVISAKPQIAVMVQETAGALELDSGKLKIRLPRSRLDQDSGEVPGPIVSFNGGQGWMGKSTLFSPRHPVHRIKVEALDNGPLFVRYRLTYGFEGGGTYVATAKLVAGYSFVQLHEEMKDLLESDGIFVENEWTDFHPTQRWVVGSPFGTRKGIADPIINAFRGEDPAFTGPSRLEDPAVEMLQSLTPYWPNGWGGNRDATFWDEKTGASLGVFVDDVSQWQDHQYAIWTSAETLKVKYRFSKNELYWKWPLITGTRQTGITVYQQKGETTGEEKLTNESPEEAEKLEEKKMPEPQRLRIWYADISLDHVKDWILDYPDSARVPALEMKPGRTKSIDEYMKKLPTCAATSVSVGMVHPVLLRDMWYWVVPDFNRYRAKMNPEQRAQATAVLLFASYVASKDEYSPIVTMLGGHPNFMGDLKFPIAAASYLFPDHPMAKEWREQYQKFMELCSIFYVRPEVSSWNAQGGRFTESIATYNWAFVDSTTLANNLILETEGENAYANAGLANMGDYIVGILTAPVTLDPTQVNWPDNQPLTWENKFKRIHPPQGAHSSKRGAGEGMYTLGKQMMNYRPLTAEHLMWGAWPSMAGKENNAVAVNRGTNPHLVSAKYTGYGFVLRAAVDTPEEISVYLQQVDAGPNYRWGYANQNGSGDVYYYAKGHSFSGHEREEAGDGHVDDAFFSCNTGVYRNWHFSSIGMNELTEPLYNLDTTQFAELKPKTGPGAYSWPEYQNRSVLMMNADYIIIRDQVLDPCGTRFSWSISQGDEMPNIIPIRGQDNFVNITDPKTGKVRGMLSTMIKSDPSHVALVTHKDNINLVRNKANKGAPYVEIESPDYRDYIFESDDSVNFSNEEMTFSGRIGTMRATTKGQIELALIHGRKLGYGGVTLSLDHPETGISAHFNKNTAGEAAGRYFAPASCTLTLVCAGGTTGKFYVDGVEINGNEAMAYTLPAGDHHWQFTSHAAMPGKPEILFTENHSGGARVYFTKVAAASSYAMEISQDNGLNWKFVGKSADSPFDVVNQSNGSKIHVRVTAVNTEQVGNTSREYPVYVTDQAPAIPEGLNLKSCSGHPLLSWGEVLGKKEYRLYKRRVGQKDYSIIYHGAETRFTDEAETLPRHQGTPGFVAEAHDLPSGLKDKNEVIEYAISALNDNQESLKSPPVSTDASSWLNWYPDIPLKFKRRSQFWMPPWVTSDQAPDEFYPENKN